MKLPIALQLYSIYEEMDKDFKGTLEKVAKIGFQGVELAGYGGLTSTELKTILDRLDLRPCGSHVSLDEITENIDEVIRYNIEIGNEYIIIPYAVLESKEDFEELAEKLNVFYEKFKDAGLRVGYHNHQHEFIEFNGQYGLDLILNNTKKEIISELDVYWVQYAGISPVEYIKKHSDRIDILHIKDMEVFNGEKRSTEIGNGIIDVPTIIEVAKEIGVKWIVIEQEFFTKPCLESIKQGFEYLNKVANQ